MFPIPADAICSSEGTFTSPLPREGLLAGDRQHRDVCLAGNGPALATRVVGSPGHGTWLQAGLRGSHLLLLVAIKACGSGCLSGRTGCKREKTGRGVVALETPEEAGDSRECLSLIPGNSMGYCVLSHLLPLIFQAHSVISRNKGCYCSPGAQQRCAPSSLPAPCPVRASKFLFLQ